MRNLIGLMLGLYFTIALTVLGGGIYGFIMDQSSHSSACNKNWIPFVAIRAAVWPKTWYDNRDMDLGDWLTVNYSPPAAECG